MSRRTEVFDDCCRRATDLAATNEAWALCAADLAYCATDDRFRIAVRQMQDAREGLPGAASYEPKVSGGGSGGSVQERVALGRIGKNGKPRTDRQEADRRALDAALRTLLATIGFNRVSAEQAAHRLRRLVDVWCTRPASDLDRRKALEENRKLEGCQHHQTANIFEPVYKAQTTVAGRVQPPLDLCEPCYDHVRRYDKLPNGEWMEARKRTGKAERERVTQRGKVKA